MVCRDSSKLTFMSHRGTAVFSLSLPSLALSIFFTRSLTHDRNFQRPFRHLFSLSHVVFHSVSISVFPPPPLRPLSFLALALIHAYFSAAGAQRQERGERLGKACFVAGFLSMLLNCMLLNLFSSGVHSTERIMCRKSPLRGYLTDVATYILYFVCWQVSLLPREICLAEIRCYTILFRIFFSPIQNNARINVTLLTMTYRDV